MMLKRVKQLNKCYKKSFKNMQKHFFDDKSIGVYLFVEYLRYLRDLIILKNYEDQDYKLKAATIAAAIAEFESWHDSREADKKAFHWNNFCEFVKQNMEEWLKTNDSV